mmetsp:Transcript_39278/g.91637  ORF Transcript_39278/g.91637 Transcript_39278/m.91637 type:complete len:117 (-) Transcript_39278:267-617(-)|eukprot:CAMPEP_0113321750 /NCGR_PEP_ID=MMETSP0010_2-20120614/15127_1 /TAXON_ID=216773 ORGANISM="Corethron hystrix, Strain 308" /NCGR_SAMPLE_ID=MMETSP0010_2 /ASSEMBLY_ACC=CAM_ASM_000155 /LENGTH=116 /DNA_ID=CAMNT_0000179981 /DNA_START=161 /DNA_END=511 /DNA_ORIENTATION=+ /assembly_acc=CAM_ASM_000155
MRQRVLLPARANHVAESVEPEPKVTILPLVHRLPHRYGTYLLDPESFALNKWEAANERDGYRNWEEAAVGRSDDPEATRERIAKFKAESRIKAYAVIGFFSAALLYSSYQYQHGGL